MCKMHYQRQHRKSKLGMKKIAPIKPEAIWLAIRGRGWVLASEVATLAQCTERIASKALAELSLSGRVEVIPGGEDGRADLWEAKTDPRASLEAELVTIQIAASKALMDATPSGIKSRLREIIDASHKMKESLSRLG